MSWTHLACALGVVVLLFLDIEHWGSLWLLLRALGAAVCATLCAVKSPWGTLGQLYAALCVVLAAVRQWAEGPWSFRRVQLGVALACHLLSGFRLLRLVLCALSPTLAHHLQYSPADASVWACLSVYPPLQYWAANLLLVWPHLPYWFTEQIVQQVLRARFYFCLYARFGWVWTVVKFKILLYPWVHWFMRPYLVVYQYETRQEVNRRAHKAGIYLKSSTLKHRLLTPRTATQCIQRQNPAVRTPHHLRLLAIITFALSAFTVAAAGGTGRTGFAAAASSMDAAQLVSNNLHHFALMDLGNAFDLLSAQRQATPALTAFLRSPDVPPGLTRSSPEHPQHWVFLQECARHAANVSVAADPTDEPPPLEPDPDWQGPLPGQEEQAHATIDDFTPEGAAQADPTLNYTTDPENLWVIGNHPGLTPAMRDKLQEALVSRRPSCFAYQMSDLTGYKGEKFKIVLKHDRPIMQKPRKHAPLEVGIQDEKCVELHGAGFVVQSPKNCQYASNATMPAKKDADGNWTDFRFCLDYRNINEATVADHYGMHLPEELFAAVAGSSYFSKIDLRGAFHQILVEEESQQYTSFFWRNQQFSYTRMPYVRHAQCLRFPPAYHGSGDRSGGFA